MKDYSKKGLTLIELVVVIAILAILLAAIIPSFMGFIDRGRFSNDVQRAKSMTTILQNTTIDNRDQLDAYDIRSIINDANGTPVNFTPEARHTGFFYIDSRHAIIAAKYDDIQAHLNTDTWFQRGAYLLNENELDQGVPNSPEELFANGAHLLTTEGSPVAMAVDFIRNMADTGTSIRASYESVQSAFETYQDNPFIRFFQMGIDEDTAEIVRETLAYYHPDHTLFVNNVSWTTTASSAESIQSIVFSAGMSHIPTFNLNLTNKVQIETLNLPKTIKTISAGGFSDDFFSIELINIAPDTTLIAEHGAFPLDTEVSRTILYETIGLIDYSNEITITVNQDGGVEYDLDDLSIREDVTGYSIDNKDGFITLKIYTKDGLIGFASNAYMISYYLNTDTLTQDIVYFVSRNTHPQVDLPPDPYLTGYVFSGWYLNPEGTGDPLQDNDLIPTRLVDVYAKWVKESEG
jgi:prepilin-type N-terminal cleavage/methylation domain-containing protein